MKTIKLLKQIKEKYSEEEYKVLRNIAIFTVTYLTLTVLIPFVFCILILQKIVDYYFIDLASNTILSTLIFLMIVVAFIMYMDGFKTSKQKIWLIKKSRIYAKKRGVNV